MSDKAVVWDLDGVIVDTAPAHFAAWRELGRRHGREITEQEFRATFGQRNKEIIRLRFGADLDEERVRALSAEKEELFRAAVAGRARALPGVRTLLASLKKAGYAQAIGSSAPRGNIALLLEALGIRRYFEAIVAEEDVTAGKPDPEIFLLAARCLGVAPLHCMVIEDAVAGVDAAKAAGMACIAVTNTRDRQALAAADLVVGSLEEVGVATIDRLLRQRQAQSPGD